MPTPTRRDGSLDTERLLHEDADVICVSSFTLVEALTPAPVHGSGRRSGNPAQDCPMADNLLPCYALRATANDEGRAAREFRVLRPAAVAETAGGCAAQERRMSRDDFARK